MYPTSYTYLILVLTYPNKHHPNNFHTLYILCSLYNNTTKKQGMSVSKLRNKEESAFAAKKVQKKVELQKPLTMAEALKERLARRNGLVMLCTC